MILLAAQRDQVEAESHDRFEDAQTDHHPHAEAGIEDDADDSCQDVPIATETPLGHHQVQEREDLVRPVRPDTNTRQHEADDVARQKDERRVHQDRFPERHGLEVSGEDGEERHEDTS